MSIDPAAIDAITFDCYGTLIDWEAGIVSSVAPVLASHGSTWSRSDILRAYSEIEHREETGSYLPYREVLRRVMQGIGERAGIALSTRECETLVRSFADWPVYPDTPPALQALKTRFRIGVLSNVDRDLFALTAPKLGVALDVLVTAEDVRSYKPARGHFMQGLARLGIPPSRVLHAAESPYHDLGVAREMGMRTAWVRRRQGSGPTASGDAVAHADLVVADMSELARMLGL